MSSGRIVVFLVSTALAAQTLPPGEMTMRDEPATFRSKVNLVLVPVVVRDRQGHAVGTLKKEDFLLYDQGKPQFIARFSVEKAGTSAIEFAPDPQDNPTAKTSPPTDLAERYSAYLFDDMHLGVGDLMQVQQAALKYLGTDFRATDRAAVYTTSGQTTLDFTNDQFQLRQAILQIRPRSRTMGSDCPPVTYYMADLIQNKNDPQALQVATADALACGHLDPTTMMQVAQQMAQSAAQRAISTGDADSRLSLGVLKNAIRRLHVLPGQRTLVLISPGFITPYLHTEVTEAMDAAIRSRVTIHSLDARGLHTLGTGPDASQQTVSLSTVSAKSSFEATAAIEEGQLLGELADGTGGIFFHNSNDLAGGFQRLAGVPEYTYILAFSPENLKLNGNYHALKVKIKEPNGLTLQARRGYYAPKHLVDPAEEARREVEEALFSREVMRDIPLELHTQFFKSGDYDAKLSVLAKVNLAQLRYKKVDGRNLNNLTVVSGLFDRNGNYVQGLTKTIEMKLKDDTLANRSRNVITIKSSFDVKTGPYVIRLVVRDSEGQMMAAQNGAVEIP